MASRARAGLASSRQMREHSQAFLLGAISMIGRVLLLVAMTVVVAVSASPAIADRRVALVIGNSAYQNVARL